MSTVSAFKAHVPFRRLITVMALLVGLLAVATIPAMAATPRQEAGVRPTSLVFSGGGFDPGFRMRTNFVGPWAQGITEDCGAQDTGRLSRDIRHQGRR
jgi:hypothetical protein